MDRGVKHFDDGDIQELACKEMSDTIRFRAKCVASQRKKKHIVYASVEKKSGRCLCAKCECPQGVSGNRSHVCGLLLAFEFIHRTKEQYPGDVSCTSRLCKWRRPRNVQVTPKPLSEIAIYRPTSGQAAKKPKVKHFDPRDKEDRVPNAHSHLKDLLAVTQNSGLQLLWDVPVETPTVCVEVEVERSCLDEMAEALVIFPKQSCSAGSEALFSDEAVQMHVRRQTITKELSLHIEGLTRLQSLCPLRKKLHVRRLTIHCWVKC